MKLKKVKVIPSHTARKKRQRGLFLIALGVVLVFIAGGVYLTMRVQNNNGKNDNATSSHQTESKTDSSQAQSSESNSSATSSQNAESQSSSVASETTSQENQSSISSAPPAESQTSDGTAPAWNQDLGVPAIPSPAPGDFSHSLFIGDSRTRGLMQYTDLVSRGSVFYTSTGLNVSTAQTKAIVPDANGNMLTIPQALETAQFNKVYIMLGVNELGWAYSDIFIEEYTKLVQAVKAAEPNAAIYVQSIVPVSAEKTASDPIYNNVKIAEYNVLIQQMAIDQGVGYLDVKQSLVDENGCLPAEATSDGVHFNKDYCQKWLEYLQNNS